MGQRTKVGILLVAIIVLGGVAAWRFWHSTPPPPTDRNTYLEQELVRLLDADAENLQDSERRIKNALGSNADTVILLEAFFAEVARRHSEANQQHANVLSAVPRMPEGANGWEAFMVAGAYARRVEDDYPYLNPNNDDTQGASEFLAASIRLPGHIASTLTADHITAPTDLEDTEKVPTPFSVTRMTIRRVSALLSTGERATAVAEATSLLQLNSRISLGPALIHELVRVPIWELMLDDLLLRLNWEASELESLVRAANPPAFDLGEIMTAEVRYLLLKGWSEEPDPEFAGWGLDELLKQHGFLPLNDLIDASIALSERTLKSRLTLSVWCEANPGDVLEPDYFRQVEARLDESERSFFLSSFRGVAETRAQRLAVDLKLLWLKKTLEPNLQFDMEYFSTATDVVVLEQVGNEYHINLNPSHPLAAYSGSELPLAVMPLPESE